LIFGIAGSFRIASLAKRVGCARENPAKLQFFDRVLTQTCHFSAARPANYPRWKRTEFLSGGIMLRGLSILRRPRKLPALASVPVFVAVAFAMLFGELQPAYSLPIYKVRAIPAF